MNKIKTIITALAFAFTPVLNANPYDMGQVNQKVEDVINTGLHNTNTSIDVKTLLDSASFIALKQKCISDWQQIGQNIEHVGSGDSGHTLVFLAMSYLNAADYMSFLESVVLKYSNNLVSDLRIKSLLFNEGPMGAFIVDNYNHNRVISILNTIKNKTADNAFKQRINGILDGSAKETLDGFREGHEGLPEGDIPEVLLGS